MSIFGIKSPFGRKSRRTNLDVLKEACQSLDQEFKRLNAPRIRDSPYALEKSSITANLDDIVTAVVRDDKIYRKKSSARINMMSPWRGVEKGTSDCLEYILRTRLFHTLVAYAIPNRPLGIRSAITVAIDRILKEVHHSVLAASAIHSAVRKFVHVCIGLGDVQNPTRKKAFIRMVRTLCRRLKDPTLALVFFQLQRKERLTIWERIQIKERKRRRRKAKSSRKIDKFPQKAHPFPMSTPTKTATRSRNPGGMRVPPKTAPGNLKKSLSRSDSKMKSVESLESLSTGKEEDDLKGGLSKTDPYGDSKNSGDDGRADGQLVIFSALLPVINDDNADATMALDALRSLAQLPNRSAATQIANDTGYCLHLVRGLEYPYRALQKATTAQGANSMSSLKKAKYHLYDRVEYIDDVARTTYPVIALQMAKRFRESFLEPLILRDLSATDEKTVASASNIAGTLFHHLGPGILQDTLVKFLIGSEVYEFEKRGVDSIHPLRSKLIRRMNSESKRIAFYTLRIFSNMIAAKNQIAMHNLILRNLHDFRLVKDTKQRKCLLQQVDYKVMRFEGVKTLGDVLITIQKSLNINGAYLVEAKDMVVAWNSACSSWDKGFNNQSTKARLEAKKSALDSKTSAEAETSEEKRYYGGLFLDMLCSRLQLIIESPLGINLIVTSILSNLAACPNPYLHHYMLSSNIESKDPSTCPINILRRVNKTARYVAMADPNFDAKFRAKMNNLTLNAEKGLRIAYLKTDTTTIDQIILLNEFLGELASIAKAKAEIQAIDTAWARHHGSAKRSLKNQKLNSDHPKGLQHLG
ncbi:hypothetical protein AAMO2058_000817900 [Amorphochlora amoebiformis]